MVWSLRVGVVCGLVLSVVSRADAQICDPQLVDTTIGIRGIAASGDLAVAPLFRGGLRVFERDAGGAVDVLAEVPGGPEFIDVRFSGSTAVAMLNDRRSVQIWDLSDPASPALAATVPSPLATNLNRFDIRGGLLMLSTTQRFYLYDVSDPAAPTPLSDRAWGSQRWSAELGDGVLVAAGSPVKVWDLSDPSSPVELPSLPGGQASLDGGLLALVPFGVPEVRVYDFQNPSAPGLLGSAPIGIGGDSHLDKISLTGDTLWFSVSRDFEPGWWIEIWDVADPSQPLSLYQSSAFFHHGPGAGVFETSAFVGVPFGDEFVFASEGDAWVYDDVRQSLDMSFLSGDRLIYPIEQIGGQLAVLRHGRLEIGPMSSVGAFEPAGSVALGPVSAESRPETAFVHREGDVLFFALEDSGFQSKTRIVSVGIADPSQPELIDSVSLPQPPTGVGYADGSIYVIGSSISTIAMDRVVINGAGDLFALSHTTLALPSLPRYGVVGVDGGLLVFSGDDLLAFDITAGLTPTLVSTLADTGASVPHLVIGDRVYTGSSSGPALVFDVGNPHSPSPVAVDLPVPAGSRLIAATGTVLLFVDGSDLLRVDVSDHDAPLFIGSHALGVGGLPLIGTNASVVGDSLFFDLSVGSPSGLPQFSEFDLEACGLPGCAVDIWPQGGDGFVNFFDVIEFLTRYNSGDPSADWAAPSGVLNFFDLAAYLAAYAAGCP